MHINDYLNQLNNKSSIGYSYYDMDVNNDYIIKEFVQYSKSNPYRK